MWHEIDRNQQVITYAMNIPRGVIIRVSAAYDSQRFQLIHLDNMKVENGQLVPVIPEITSFPSHGAKLYHENGQYYPAQFTAQ